MSITAKGTSAIKLTPTLGDRTLAQEWLDDAEEVGPTDIYKRRMRKARTSWCQPLEIHVYDEAGNYESYFAGADYISEEGIGFKCREQLPAYTKIVICLEGEMVGVPSVAIDNIQTISGYIIETEFRFEERPPVENVLSKVG